MLLTLCSDRSGHARPMTPDDQRIADTLMLTTWEQLPFLSASAAQQMAIDTVMARICESKSPRALLRLYRMDPPAVTIGRHQRWRTVIDEDECRRRGWEWARRPTGGGALLHRHEINYAVAASHSVFGESASFNHAYHCIMCGLSTAVQMLGGRPTLNMGRSSVSMPAVRSARGLCEQSLTHFEIAVDGKKAVAAAQWYSTDTVLQHGTIYLQAPKPSDRFWPPASHDRTSQSHAPAWWDAAVGTPSSDEGTEIVANAVRDGLAQALNLNLTEIGYDQIDPQMIHDQLREWDRENWNRRR